VWWYHDGIAIFQALHKIFVAAATSDFLHGSQKEEAGAPSSQRPLLSGGGAVEGLFFMSAGKGDGDESAKTRQEIWSGRKIVCASLLSCLWRLGASCLQCLP
jgi:hypothetical protein